MMANIDSMVAMVARFVKCNTVKNIPIIAKLSYFKSTNSTNSGSSGWDNTPLLVATVADLCSSNYPGKELLEKILVVSITTNSPFFGTFTIPR